MGGGPIQVQYCAVLYDVQNLFLKLHPGVRYSADVTDASVQVVADWLLTDASV